MTQKRSDMKLWLIYFFIGSACLTATAGTFPPWKVLKPFHRIVVGLSGVVIDDDGHPLKGSLNIKQSWNSAYIPTRLSLEASFLKRTPFLKKWSAELSMAYSPLKPGKVEGDQFRTEKVNLYMFDLSAKYYPLPFLTKVISPYAIVGLGYTNRVALISKNDLSVNAGLGLSVWLPGNFGANIQCMGKFAATTYASNYLMHSLGLVYRLVRD